MKNDSDDCNVPTVIQALKRPNTAALNGVRGLAY